MHIFRKVASKLKVLARSTPEDKYLLVMGLKEMDHIVALLVMVQMMLLPFIKPISASQWA